MPDEDGNRTPAERAQYMAARGGLARIQHATKVKSERAELKRAIREFRLDPVALMAGTLPKDTGWEEILKGMPIVQVIRQVPTFGPITTLDFLAEIGLPPTAKINTLTWRVREDIAEHLRVVLATVPMHGRGRT